MNFFFFSMGLTSLLDFCANPPGQPTKINMDNIALPQMYKVSGGIIEELTAFEIHTQTIFNETATKDYRVLWRRSNDLEDRHVEELTGEQQYYHVNATDNKCTKNATKPNLLNYLQFESILGNDTLSLNSIVNSIIQFYKTKGGYVMKESSENNMAIVACIDEADIKVVMEVGYLLQPNRTDSSKPLTMAIRIIQVASYHSTKAMSQLTIDLEQEYLPVGNESFVLGIQCDNKPSHLPYVPLDEFAGVVNYFSGPNYSIDVEVFYSKPRQLFIKASEKDRDNLLQTDPKDYFFDLKKMNYVAHDFKYGYDFTMKNGECEGIEQLNPGTKDVIFVNKAIQMAVLESMIVDVGLRFYFHSIEVDGLGRSFKVYRADSEMGMNTFDVHLNSDNLIHYVSRRDKYNNQELYYKLTITPTPIKESKLHLKLAKIFDCYDSGKFAGNTLVTSLRDKNITDLTGFVSNELSHDESVKSVKIDTVVGQKSGDEKEKSVDECMKICSACRKTGLVGY